MNKFTSIPQPISQAEKLVKVCLKDVFWGKRGRALTTLFSLNIKPWIEKMALHIRKVSLVAQWKSVAERTAWGS